MEKLLKGLKEISDLVKSFGYSSTPTQLQMPKLAQSDIPNLVKPPKMATNVIPKVKTLAQTSKKDPTKVAQQLLSMGDKLGKQEELSFSKNGQWSLNS